jgi:hypothetical protein
MRRINATRFPLPRGRSTFRDGSFGEYAVVTTINPRLPLPWGSAINGARRGAVATRLGRVWAVLRENLAVGGPARLQDLNDDMLGDIGMTRTDLDYELAFWRVWRPRSHRCE